MSHFKISKPDLANWFGNENKLCHLEYMVDIFHENMFKDCTETKEFHQKYYIVKCKLKFVFGFFPTLFVSISLKKCLSV